jgi:hypothetical protein
MFLGSRCGGQSISSERGGERIELCSRSEALFPLFAYARLFLRMGALHQKSGQKSDSQVNEDFLVSF